MVLWLLLLLLRSGRSNRWLWRGMIMRRKADGHRLWMKGPRVHRLWLRLVGIAIVIGASCRGTAIGTGTY